MSQGAYIEVANRAFHKVEAKVEDIDSKEWEHHNPDTGKVTNLTKSE